MDFRRETVAELASAVRAGHTSASDPLAPTPERLQAVNPHINPLVVRDLVAHSLERIEALNPDINAFVVVDADAAMASAAEIDRQVAEGDDPGPLAGIPIGVKDLEDAIGFPTSHGSAAYAATEGGVATN